MANFDLTISPSQIEFVLKPGTTIVQAYQITNNSLDHNIVVNTEIKPWYPQGNDGSVNYQDILPNPNIFFSLGNSDIQLNQPFTLAPKESKQVVLKIKTNSQTELSDAYYTFFVYQDQNISKSSDSISQTTGKIGSHILLSVSNQQNQDIKAEIKNFHSSSKYRDVLFGQINFDADIQNKTDYFFKTTGKITVLKDQKNIKELELNSNNVLAHHYRRLGCNQQESCSLQQPLWPGKYTAQIQLDPDYNVDPASVSFTILPISPIIFIALLIASFFAFRYIKKAVKR